MTELVQYLYLSHVIDKNGLHLSQEKLRAIQEAPEPCNITELKSLPNFANFLFPIYRLLQKNVRWMWTNEQSDTFVKAC